MLRFIFVCMGVVALSLVAIGAQYMTDGISDEAADVVARNAEQEENAQTIAVEDTVSPEDLNAIETTANTGKCPHVATSNFVGDLNYAEPSVVKRSIEQADTRKQGKNKSRHKTRPQNDN